MRWIAIFGGLVLVVAVKTAGAAEPPPPSELLEDLLPGEYTVACVNGEPVPHSDLLGMSSAYKDLLAKRGRRVGAGAWTAADEELFQELAGEMRRQALARLVSHRILFQEAQRALVADLVKKVGREAVRGIFGSAFRDEINMRALGRSRMTLGMYRLYDRDFDRRMEMRLRQLGGPDVIWKRHHLTPEQFRQMFFERSLVIEYRQRVLRMASEPAPREIRAFYRANQDRFRRDESVEARILTIRWGAVPVGGGPVRDRAAARALIMRLRAEAQAAPARFGALVREHSDDAATRSRGGRMGTESSPAFVRGTYDKELEREAFGLAPGKISGVITARDAFHVLLVEARHAAGVRPLAEVESAIRRELQKEKRQLQERQIVARLYDRAAVLDAEGQRIPYEVLYGERP